MDRQVVENGGGSVEFKLSQDRNGLSCDVQFMERSKADIDAGPLLVESGYPLVEIAAIDLTVGIPAPMSGIGLEI